MEIGWNYLGNRDKMRTLTWKGVALVGFCGGAGLLWVSLRRGYLFGHDLMNDVFHAESKGNFDKVFKMAYPLALAGNPKAQYLLGQLYELGRGVSRDPSKAFSWYRKAAEAGMLAAEQKTGLMYNQGRGITSDDVRSLQWLRRAAEGGMRAAQSNTAFMYEFGRGTGQDYVEAYKWYSLAEEGMRRSPYYSQVLRLKNKMTSAQIYEAQKRLREYKAAHSATSP